ncbi:MAG TPA: hypothetical protein DCY40_03450, partial [Actinobacteria bacterium]|nr:hypothetical protein [Actinomycetota bacterium]
MRARYGDDVRQHAVDFYRRHGSFSAAAAELGVSASWVYGVVRDSGIDRAELPVWPASLARRAAELYVEERLSCRAVAARLAAERGGAGPSHEWVAEQLRQRGLLRGKSAGQRARAEAVSRRDYADLERKARALFARGESARAVADRLGIARRTVVRWVGRTRDPATATRVRAWEAPRDDVRERLA